MWLAERAAAAAEKNTLRAEVCETTMGGDLPAALGRGESRELAVLSAGGIWWKPEPGKSVLVISCGDGGVVAGTVQSGWPAGLLPGEVCIKTPGAELRVKNDGGIELTGSVRITGTLTLNGSAVN